MIAVGVDGEYCSTYLLNVSLSIIYHLFTVVRGPGCVRGCGNGSLELFWFFFASRQKRT
ncbi:MAG: hypothetical protein ABIN57_06045 [Chitinophagaceae bacterium]